MSPKLGTLLDWSFADLAVLAIALQQYISISRDLKRTKAKEAEEAAKAEPPG